jgi:hypothetical protein
LPHLRVHDSNSCRLAQCCHCSAMTLPLGVCPLPPFCRAAMAVLRQQLTFVQELYDSGGWHICSAWFILSTMGIAALKNTLHEHPCPCRHGGRGREGRHGGPLGQAHAPPGDHRWGLGSHAASKGWRPAAAAGLWPLASTSLGVPAFLPSLRRPRVEAAPPPRCAAWPALHAGAARPYVCRYTQGRHHQGWVTCLAFAAALACRCFPLLSIACDFVVVRRSSRYCEVPFTSRYPGYRAQSTRRGLPSGLPPTCPPSAGWQPARALTWSCLGWCGAYTNAPTARCRWVAPLGVCCWHVSQTA